MTSLNILTQNWALAVLFERRHRRGQEVPRAPEKWARKPGVAASERGCTSQHYATEISDSYCRSELQLSLSCKFNFKYTQYLRKWWNQNHCSTVDIRMHPSVHHHLVAPPKTFHKHLLSLSYLTSTAKASSNPCSSLLGCCPSAIPLHVLPHDSLFSLPFLLAERSCIGMGGHFAVVIFALQVWIHFTHKQTPPYRWEPCCLQLNFSTSA